MEGGGGRGKGGETGEEGWKRVPSTGLDSEVNTAQDHLPWLPFEVFVFFLSVDDNLS